jgi:hypothetical protein
MEPKEIFQMLKAILPLDVRDSCMRQAALYMIAHGAAEETVSKSLEGAGVQFRPVRCAGCANPQIQEEMTGCKRCGSIRHVLCHFKDSYCNRRCLEG